MVFTYGCLMLNSKFVFDFNKIDKKKFEFIKDIVMIDDILAIKIIRNVNDDIKGVKIDDDELGIKEFISLNGANSIIQYYYIFINTLDGRFYIHCKKKDLQLIANEYFQVDDKDISYRIDINEIKSIKKIKLSKDTKEDLFSTNELEISGDLHRDIKELAKTDEIKNYILFDFGIQRPILPIELDDFINKYKNTDVKFVIYGKTKTGNDVTIDDIISKKIDVESLKKFEDIKNLSLSQILEEVKRRIRNE